MSWGTLITVDIEILRETFTHEYDLDVKISDTEDNIKSIESKILMYCASTPKDVIKLDEDQDNAIDSIKFTIDELLSWYREENILLYRLNLLKENFDNRITF